MHELHKIFSVRGKIFSSAFEIFGKILPVFVFLSFFREQLIEISADGKSIGDGEFGVNRPRIFYKKPMPKTVRIFLVRLDCIS